MKVVTDGREREEGVGGVHFTLLAGTTAPTGVFGGSSSSSAGEICTVLAP